MFSKILIKLIDESIVPAILLLVTRLVSVVLVSKYLNIPFEIGPSGMAFNQTEEYVKVNSYSVFAMVVVLTVGLLFILIKSLFFHDTHIKPQTTAKLFAFKLQSMIQSSYDLYTQGSIWLSYCYLLMLVAGFMAVFGFLYYWVFYVAVTLCIISTIFLVIDVEEEVHGHSAGIEQSEDIK